MASPSRAPQEQPAIAVTGITNQRAVLTDSILFYGTFSLLLFAPLAFGSVDSWSIFTLQAGAAFLLLLWTIRQAISGNLVIRANPLFRPVLSFGLLISVQIAFGVTAYGYQTIASGLLYAAYAFLLFLAVQLLERTVHVKILAWVFCLYGAGVAVFAILQSLSSNGKIYWLWGPPSGGWIYGPYVNHNHYAGLMEMLFPVALVMSLTRYIPRRWRSIPLFAAIIMAASIFLSGSRGGMIAFLVQAVVLGVLLGLRKSRQTALMAGSTLVVIAVLMLWIGGEAAVNRLTSIHREAKTEIAGGIRLSIDRDSLVMLRRKPVLGWGLGTFPIVYPEFRSFYSDKFVNRAHNDYLQLLVETGFLGFSIMLWFVTLTIRGAIRKLGDWTWDFNAAVALATLLSCTGLLVHSFVDSNLQIPANAALFYVLCGIAAADTKFGAHRRMRHRRKPSIAAESVVLTQ